MNRIVAAALVVVSACTAQAMPHLSLEVASGSDRNNHMKTLNVQWI
jgi:hypothetical protein